MITNLAMLNQWTRHGKYHICFDGAFVSVRDQQGRELSYQAMVSGYIVREYAKGGTNETADPVTIPTC